MEKVKFYLMAILVAFMGLTVTSCSSDDDNSGGSPIVGTWEETQSYSDGSKVVYTFVFNADNTGTETEASYSSSGKYINSSTSPFSYKYTDEKSSITVLWEAGGQWDGSATIIGSNLRLTFSGYFGGSTMKTYSYALKKK